MGGASSSFDMSGRVAIVTGASRGIGEAIAARFAEAGSRVTICARKADSLHAAAERIASRFGQDRVLVVAAHTGKEEDCTRVVTETTKHFGKVDVLVNNAATNPYFGSFLDVDMGAWDKTFDVNLKGYFFMAREVARHLLAREAGGSIVNVASIAGLMGSPMQGVYGMTKAAIVSMTKTLSAELAARKVRVNAIAPGWVDTRFASAVIQNDALVAEVKKRTPMQRYGVPEEIAGGALYLASDASTYMTGHTLVIDGGLTTS